MSEIRIVWRGHACFSVAAEGYTLLLDPYADGTVPGCGPLRQSAHQVLCSHGHSDHGWKEGVELLPQRPCPFAITRVAAFHDDKGGSLRGPNTIHVMEYGGLRLAHLGDLGHLLTDDQLARLGRIDGVMVPVGGYYTVDAAQADAVVRQIGAKWVIPMHYRRGEMGFDVLRPLSDFLALREDVRELEGNALSLTSETPAGTLVPRYQR